MSTINEDGRSLLGSDLDHHTAHRIAEVKPAERILDDPQQFKPRSRKYGDFSVPVYEAFDGWEKIFPLLHEGACLVVFESVRNPDADPITLAKADHLAHSAAMGMVDDYMGYYRGPLTKDGACRSFCLWKTEKAAQDSIYNPLHQEAAKLTSSMYSKYQVKRYIFKYDGGIPRFELRAERGHGMPPSGRTGARRA